MVSASEARRSIPAETSLPEQFTFRVIGWDFVCAIRTIWRRGGEVSVRIKRVGRLPVRWEPEREITSPDPGVSSHASRERFAQR